MQCRRFRRIERDWTVWIKFELALIADLIQIHQKVQEALLSMLALDLMVGDDEEED